MSVNWIFYIFLLPVFNLLLWFFLPTRKSQLYLIPTAAMLIAWIGVSIQISQPEVWQLKDWFSTFPIVISLKLESVRLSMATLTCLISLLIQFYSKHYLFGKQQFGYYSTLLSVFTTAMCWLFLADNLFTLLLGWEIIGICSYLLVQFWYGKLRPVQAGFRVLMINKLGDVALIGGLGLLVSFGFEDIVFHSFTFPSGSEIFFQSKTGNIVCLFLVLAALVKSAQFPFNIWLKEAMEGPTSVSALLHSATMVVAGIWVLIQLSPIFSPEILHFLIAIGSFTLIISNLAALQSNHIKSTLAFSTMAQLGLLTVAIGLGNSEGATAHLFTHAIFKSALFLTGGLVIRLAHEPGYHGLDAQFFPNLRGFLMNQKWVRYAFIAACAALAGAPFTSGFLSKEAIIPPEIFSGEADMWTWIAFISLQIGILLTSFYASRLVVWLCFGDDSNVPKRLHSLPFTVPILILSIGCGFWIFGFNPISTEGWLLQFWNLKGHSVPPDFVMMAIGCFLGWRSLRKGKWMLSNSNLAVYQLFVNLKPQFRLFSYSWSFLQRISDFVIRFEHRFIERPIDVGSKLAVVGGYFVSFVDHKLVDGFVLNLAATFRWMGSVFWQHSRNKPQYATYFFLSLMALIFFFLLK